MNFFYQTRKFKERTRSTGEGGQHKQCRPWSCRDSGQRWGTLLTKHCNLWVWASRAGCGEKMALIALTLHLLPLAWTKSSGRSIFWSLELPALHFYAKTWHFPGSGLLKCLWFPSYTERSVLSLVPPSPLHSPPSPKQTKQYRLRKNICQDRLWPKFLPWEEQPA